jgi:glycosyltransferase involved in cell wall biosynthesis
MLNYEFPPLGGGSGNATYYLLKEFAKHPSLRVDLVTSSAGTSLEEEEFSDRIRLYRLPVGKKEQHFWTMPEIARWTWRAYWLTRKLINSNGYDLCHCWSGWPSGVIGFALRNELPYLVGLRGSDVPGYNERLRLLDRLVFRHVSRLIWRTASSMTAVSDHLRELAQKTSSQAKIQVIHNGVDAAHFTPGNKPEQFTVLYVGRLIARKGVTHLVRAFRESCDEVKDPRLIIVGEGPERLPLQEYCRHEGIEDLVSFMGILDHKELPSVYRRASVFVMPALEEAMPNALLEAMASGLPLITTDTGAREMIDENGIVVSIGSDLAIRDAISQYIRDPELLERHRKQSRLLAERTTWAGVANAYLELYERHAGRSAKTPPMS